jgi:hypothetical protein
MTEENKEETGDDQEKVISKRKQVDTDTEEEADERCLSAKQHVNTDKENKSSDYEEEEKMKKATDGDITDDVSVKRQKISNQGESLAAETPAVSGEDVTSEKEAEKKPIRTSSRLFGSGWTMTSFGHVAATLGKSQPSFSKELKKEEEEEKNEVKKKDEKESEEEDHSSEEESREEIVDSGKEHVELKDSSSSITGEVSNEKTKTSQVVIVTGEEDEETLWNGRVKLYILHEYEGSKGSGPTKDWKECGIGILRLNRTRSDEHRSRLVMRAEGTFRLLLNAPLFKDMCAEIVQDSNLRLAVLESDRSIRHYLIRFKTAQDVHRLYTLMSERCPLRAYSGVSC